MGEFPSGQRGQTVNLLSLTSLVRIQLPPPTKNALLSYDKGAFFVIQAAVGVPRSERASFGGPVGLVWNQRASRVVWNPDEVAHGIARSAYRIKLLRLDAIHGVAVIPFRPLV